MGTGKQGARIGKQGARKTLTPDEIRRARAAIENGECSFREVARRFHCNIAVLRRETGMGPLGSKGKGLSVRRGNAARGAK